MLDILTKLLPSYEGLTWQTLGLYVLAGMFAALTRVSWLDKPLRGFYRDSRGGLRMGFYAEIITAVAVAIVVDGHPIRAGFVAIFAPWILQTIRTVLVKQAPEILRALLQSFLDAVPPRKGR